MKHSPSAGCVLTGQEVLGGGTKVSVSFLQLLQSVIHRHLHDGTQRAEKKRVIRWTENLRKLASSHQLHLINHAYNTAFLRKLPVELSGNSHMLDVAVFPSLI